MPELAPVALACRAAELFAGKAAEDVAVFRFPPGGEFEYTVLATARSERQAYALMDELLGWCKRWRIAHYPLEGEAGWYVLDCHQVVLHAMGAEQRARYALERLWRQAERVDWERELPALPELAPPRRRTGG